MIIVFAHGTGMGAGPYVPPLGNERPQGGALFDNCNINIGNLNTKTNRRN